MTAIAAAFLATSALGANNDEGIIVTATRFATADPRVPASISVITRSDIERSPARSIPDLLRSVPGVVVRSLSGGLGSDATVDIRGSGEAAGSNTLVLLDGQRLNPVDMGGVKWQTIPLAAIARIDVIRGSGSVLYGDRAAGGVINIITDKSAATDLAGSVEVGSFGYRALDAFASGGTDGWFGNLVVHDATTNGYRDNSDADSTSYSGRIAKRLTDAELFIDFAGYRQQSGLPSDLTRAQFDADPSQTNTPRYRSDTDGYRLRPGGTFRLSTDAELAIDGSVSHDELESYNPDWFYRNRRKLDTLTVSPRLRWNHSLGDSATSETVFGLDYFDAKVVSDDLNFATFARFNRQTARQENAGAYLQNLSSWDNGIDTTVAFRRQYFSLEANDEGAALHGESSDRLNAWELGLGFRFADSLRGYAKTARNFRLPNADELFAFDCSTYPCVTKFNGALKPQTGNLLEVGMTWTGDTVTQQLSVFMQDNHDEIGYIAVNGRNANLDPTRRRGAEWEGRWKPMPAWSLRANASYVDATFSEGAFDGKTIPLVPTHRESLTAEWDGGRRGQHTLTLLSVGDAYFGGDFANAMEKLGGYTTADYQGQWTLKPLTLVFRVTNLTDRKYSPSGFSGTYYPADPRSFFVAAKVDF